MGHAFQHTLMDVLIRYQRMKGRDVLWQMGTDHAGIATQMVVERQLAEAGVERTSLGREAFIDKVWEWKAQAGGHIEEQIFKMGSSVDWTHKRFTMDEGMSAAVREAFVRLYDEGIIYRGTRLVNWDTKLQTAVSDLEVVNTPIKDLGKKGALYTINYKCGDTQVPIATTRPETLFGDVALAVHPKDERFLHLIGQQAEIPVSRRLIPIIADDAVDPEFGTGCVKVTPGHDFNDYAIGERHQLPIHNIMHENGCLNDFVPEAYRRLDRFIARKQLLAEFAQTGQLIATVDHDMVVPVGDRSGTIIEPRLTNQWFLRANVLAADALDLVKSGEIRFVPDNWKNTYYRWLEDIQDWCISRQLWWGHRISAWHDEAGNVYVAQSEQEARSKYQLTNDLSLRQDDDVLDTWFSSALWTFATLGWPEQTERLVRFHPTDVLVTGFDIIFFWVARMIMMTKKLVGTIPFRTIYITGLIRDGEGEKMSKTKGNVIDPLDLISGITLDALIEKQISGLIDKKKAPWVEKKLRNFFPDGIQASGTDAMRFNFCALANTGRDINFDYQRLLGYHHFVNKIWNATRFVLMRCQEYEHTPNTRIEDALKDDISIVHRWILNRLQEVTQKSETHLEKYRFDLLAQDLHEFIWHDYCSWYLECTKLLLKDDAHTTQYLLLYVLEQFLRLLHPIMPFVTEDLWQKVKPKLHIDTQSICISAYPSDISALVDVDAQALFGQVIACVSAIRSLRGKHDVSPSQKLTAYIRAEDTTALEQQAMLICTLANTQVHFGVDDVPQSLLETKEGIQVRIPFDECIDIAKETARLQKECTNLTKGIGQLEQMLGNDKFRAKAPAAVVAEKEQQLAELQAKYALVNQELANIGTIEEVIQKEF